MSVGVRGRQVNRGPAETARAPASVMHGIFPPREGTLTAVLVEVGFSTSRQVVLPRGFEGSSRLIEGGSVTSAGRSTAP